MIQENRQHTAVVVVDVQGDFTQLHQGSLAVQGTDQAYVDTVARKTRRLKDLGYPVFATQDWHPRDHVSFFTNHEGASALDLIDLDGRSQVLWPPHCVQDTPNAAQLLDADLFDGVVQKGCNPAYDSYSGFFDDGGHATGLETLLKKEGIQKLIIYGLATDYCVRATVMDAVSLGFEVRLIQALCRGVAPESTRAALDEMAAAGVEMA